VAAAHFVPHVVAGKCFFTLRHAHFRPAHSALQRRMNRHAALVILILLSPFEATLLRSSASVTLTDIAK
jgi:hypothetical protein